MAVGTAGIAIGPTPSKPREALMQTTLEKELIGLETEFWNAIKAGDIAAAVRLSDEPCIVTGAQGVAQLDKKTFTQMMEKANWTLRDFKIDNAKVQRLSDDVAIIGYKVHEDLMVDGKPMSLDAADASTWVRKNGRWVCAMHTESLLGDSFGRDRK
jgi:ketosteroid isomerase-like protein